MTCDRNTGNYAEEGVFKGRTLLATALLLRELESKKTNLAYDSFQGFPEYGVPNFQDQLVDSSLKDISPQDELIFEKRKKLIQIKNALNLEKVNLFNVSNAQNFSNIQLFNLQKN